MGEARRRRLERETGAARSPVQTGPMEWGSSLRPVDVDSLLANRPNLYREQEWLLLGKSPRRDLIAVLPHADVSVEDAHRNVRRLFPGLEFLTAKPSVFRAVAALALGATNLGRTTYDVLFKLPERPGERHTLLVESDEAGSYVPSHLLLYGLGQYVSAVAAGFRAGHPSDFVGLKAFFPAMGLLASMPSIREIHPAPKDIPYQETLNVVHFFTGYALASYLNLDPRVVSFGLLKEEANKRHMKGLIEAFIGDLMWIVGYQPALENFLRVKTGVTVDQFMGGSEAFRIAAIVQAAGLLLGYADAETPLGRGGNEGGRKWIPKEAANDHRQPESKLDLECLRPVLEICYDQMHQAALDMLRDANGEILPTTAVAFRVDKWGAWQPTEDVFINGLTGAKEEDYIGRSLADPQCVCVLRISEAWANTGSTKTEVVAFRFLSRHFEAQAVSGIQRNPLHLVKSTLQIRPVHTGPGG